jgi:hypothetical protein
MEVTAHAPVSPERRNTAARDQLLRRIRGEFEEMPCLCLTYAQARRLFGLSPDVCQRVLIALVREHTLACGPDGRYRLRQDVPLRTALRDIVFSTSARA